MCDGCGRVDVGCGDGLGPFESCDLCWGNGLAHCRECDEEITGEAAEGVRTHEGRPSESDSASVGVSYTCGVCVRAEEGVAA